MSKFRWWFAGALAAALAGVFVVMPNAGAAPAVAAQVCAPVTWGSAAKTAGGESTAQLVSIVASRTVCYDRIVFTFSGPVSGYRLAYENSFTDGQGLHLNPYTAGGATLNLVLNAPATNANAIARTGPVGQHRAFGSFLLFRTLRDGVYGGSFEGRTTLCIGVRARLPMRVLVLSSPPRIEVQVAHTWTGS